jgi:hypothetical protein
MKDKTEDERRKEIEKRLKEKGKKIDLFMNVGTFMKYSGWLNLKDSHEINSVTVLMPNIKYGSSLFLMDKMLFQFNRVGFCDDIHTKQRRALNINCQKSTTASQYTQQKQNIMKLLMISMH